MVKKVQFIRSPAQPSSSRAPGLTHLLQKSGFVILTLTPPYLDFNTIPYFTLVPLEGDEGRLWQNAFCGRHLIVIRREQYSRTMHRKGVGVIVLYIRSL